MIKEIFKFAGQYFKVEHTYKYFSNFAKDYVVDVTSPSFEVVATEEDAINWKNTHESEEGVDFPLPYLETLVVHSKVADILSKIKTFIFHGSTIYLDNPNNAYIFTAPSGTGKSTHTRLLKSMFGERIQYINDDKPFISSLEDNNFKVYGSPWDGKERRSQNIDGILKGIFIIERSKTCSVTKLNPKDAINFLIKQMHIPSGIEGTLNGTEFLVKLCKEIPIYKLCVDMSEDAPKTSYSIMNMKEGN